MRNVTNQTKATRILADHYAGTFERYGPSADGVDWGSYEKHCLRLQGMVAHIGADIMAAESLLDVGCGYGELLRVLEDRFAVRPKHYTGIDPCRSMIQAARTKYPSYCFEACAFEDFIPQKPVDRLFCCGVFTKKVYASDIQMYDLLDSFFAFAKKMRVRSITFNTMSPLCDVHSTDLFFPNIDRIINTIRKYWGFDVKKYLFSNDYLRYEMIVHIDL